MSCLKRVWRFLVATLLRLDYVPRSVSPEERISRFIFYRRYIRGGSVDYAVFMPGKTNATSVYRTKSCSENRIWLLGKIFVADLLKESRELLGRADSCRRRCYPDPGETPYYSANTLTACPPCRDFRLGQRQADAKGSGHADRRTIEGISLPR